MTMKWILFALLITATSALGQVVNPPVGSIAGFSCVAGAASGVGATCACATNHICSTHSGVLTVVTGTGTSAGVAVTVTLYASAQPNYPSCAVVAETTSAFSTAVYTIETSTGFIRQAWSAPAASTTYTVHYQCGF